MKKWNLLSRRLFFIPLALTLVFVSLCTHAEIYRWKDENGNWRYGDKASVQNAPEMQADIESIEIKHKYSVKNVVAKDPIPYTAELSSRLISIEAIELVLKDSDVTDIRIGRITCGPPKDLYWVDGHVNVNDPELAKDTLVLFQKNNYQINQNIGKSSNPSALNLKMKIINITLNICEESRHRKLTKNDTYVEIQWSLFDPILQKNIFETTTEGSHHAGNFRPVKNGTTVSLSAAISVAAENLLSEEAFVSFLGHMDIQKSAQKEAGTEIRLDLSYGNGNGKFHSKAGELKNNSVIVKLKDGHGSGIFIDSSGHLLTNAHVIGDETTFTIITGSGIHYPATLVRKNIFRDVALIKIDSKQHGLNGVKIAATMPAIGSDVFIIGTPLDVSHSHSVTKGIISAERKIQGLNYYQTDASINLGNSGGPVFNDEGELIALTVAGVFSRDGINLNINYVIPIDDALNKLNVKPSDWIDKLTQKTEISPENDATASLGKFAKTWGAIRNWLDKPIIRF